MNGDVTPIYRAQLSIPGADRKGGDFVRALLRRRKEEGGANGGEKDGDAHPSRIFIRKALTESSSRAKPRRLWRCRATKSCYL